MATEANITIKLLIDTETNKVVFAEASKDFVDFLLFVLALPIGSVTKILTSEYMVGSFGNLYKSVVNLSQSYFQQDIDKKFFIDPKIDLPSVSTYIPLPGYSHISNDAIGSQGYVKEMVTYMVSDDLSVMPLSTMLIISMTKACNASKLEERTVKIGTKEALELLKSSLQSTTVLTDVFLTRKHDKSKAPKVEDVVSHSNAHELKERDENVDELLDARTELVNVFETLEGGLNVGIKTMGAIDSSPFRNLCYRRYGDTDDWVATYRELLSLWQGDVNDPEWHPFKIIVKDGKDQEVVDEDNTMLKNLKSEWGADVYNAVVKALMEINEYNPSRQPHGVKQLWNFKEDRKASVREAIQCLCDHQLKNPPAECDKRRRTM